MPNKVSLTIDGAEIEAEPGTMIIQAAMSNGMYIPYLCYYPGMKPYGACRMCVVEAEAKGPDGEYRSLPGSPAACTTPVSDGMKVHTNTRPIAELRKGIMDLLLSEHPHGCLTCHRIELCGPSDICLRHVSVNDRCVTCPKNERCELKDTVRYLEMDMDTPLTYNNRNLPLAVSDPYWDMDMNLCIVCSRCVRACDEVRADNAITLLDRSGKSIIGTSQGTSLLESGCEFCGACIDVCPTGALVERKHKWEKAVKEVSTICPHCPVGCRINLEVSKKSQIIRSIPDRLGEANRGQACFKGKFGMEYLNSGKRLLKPMVKSEGVFNPTSWPDALDLIAQRLSGYKGNQYAMVVSPMASNEDNFVAQKFAREVMRTNNINVSSDIRPQLTETLGKILGIPAATNSIWELLDSKAFMVVSSNLTEEQNVAAIPIKQATRAGAKLIVIDQRETELTRHASLWIRPKPGTESIVIGGIIRSIFDETLEDRSFLSNNCHNLDSFRGSLWEFDHIKVELLTGVSQEDIRTAARLFAAASLGSILFGLETVRPELTSDCVRALVNLALSTGNIGKPSCGLYPLFSGANHQGSLDVGCAPVHLPGYRDLGESEDLNTPDSDGIRLSALAQAMSRGQVKALQLLGNSPNFLNGEIGPFFEALKAVEFLVVHDSFPSEITEVADVILPISTFAEISGTFTNMERRVQMLRPAVGQKGDEDETWRIIAQLAKRMGNEAFPYNNTSEIFEEIRQTIPEYSGISYERLQTSGLQWPCLSRDSVETPVLYSKPDNQTLVKAKLSSMLIDSDLGFHVNPEYPFLLAVGRLLHQPGREARISVIEGNNTISRDEIIELNAKDAAALGISTGDLIRATSLRDQWIGNAVVNGIHSGLVATTRLFGQHISERAIANTFDSMPDFPGIPLTPVKIERIDNTEHGKAPAT